MKTPQDIVDTMMAADEFSRAMGMNVTEVLAGEVVVEMTVRKDMLNGHDVCHGGVLFSLADSAMAFASNSHGRVALSIESNISQLHSVKVGELVRAHATETLASNKLAVYSVQIERVLNSGETECIAQFKGTVYRTSSEF